MTSLFPPREILVVTSRLGTGNSRTFIYGVEKSTYVTTLSPGPRCPSRGSGGPTGPSSWRDSGSWRAASRPPVASLTMSSTPIPPYPPSWRASIRRLKGVRRHRHCMLFWRMLLTRWQLVSHGVGGGGGGGRGEYSSYLILLTNKWAQTRPLTILWPISQKFCP
jgi:hypothetical protein